MADATYTSEQYAIDLLHRIGNADPSAGAVAFVEEWIKHETKGPGGARFNPLNTTQPEAGSTYFNHLSGNLGVQNFTSYWQGVDANAQVLENGYYPSLLAALRTNDLPSLGVFSGQESSGVAANLRTWGTGAFPVAGLDSANQTFVVSPFSGGSNSVPASTQAATAANTSTPAANGSPVQINAGVLIMLGAVFLIILVAAGTIKSRQLATATPALQAPGGQEHG